MKYLIRSFLIVVLFTALLGFIYPCLTFMVGHLFLKEKTYGSLIKKEGKIVGSKLIAQPFSSAKYFHPRPSFNNYNGMASGSNNLSVFSKKFEVILKEREERYRKVNSIPNEIIPIDAITESSSGLDPHISKKNGYLQAERIGKARNIPKDKIIALIDRFEEKPLFHILGKSRVNVLLLNIALDELYPP
jgi:potassium-transporting ATPase KdpC subunit